MKKTTILSARLAALIAGLALATSAHAGSTWAFTGVTSTDGANATTVYGTGTGKLTISGVYASNDTSDNNGFAAGAKWQSGTLTHYSGGLGMSSDGSSTPNHAIDNSGTYTEGVLLSFGSSQVLTSIGLGYVSGDADLSVWRYTGTSAPTMTGGADYASMVAAGWELVGNYANMTTDTSSPYNLVNNAKADGSPNTNTDAGADSKGSSWWLVTAYNASYGGGTGLSQGDDYFKIYAVAATTCDTTKNVCSGKTVAEPGSLALAGLAIGGVFFSRRRKVVAQLV